MSSLVYADAAPDQPARPQLAAIVRHLACSLSIATVIPSALFYVALTVGSIWIALGVALGWCYGAMAWRLKTGRRCSALLWITAAGLTAKTAVSVATGSTFVYFLQPALTEAAIAVLFLLSLFGARPVVARFAGDFYPMTEEIARRPRIQKLFSHLTLMWALLCFGQAGITLWLLESTSMHTFVAARAGVTIGFALSGATATVAFAARIARREGLLGSARRALEYA